MKRLLALVLALLPATSFAQTLDYNIANQTTAAFRADLNNHLVAIAQQNAGQTAPSTTFPYMVWADTSGAAPVLRFRNAANSGWAAAFRIDPSSTMWLGGITTSSATITGGSINGAAIGQTTPAAGTFTSGIIVSTAPNLTLVDSSGTAPTHAWSRLLYNDSVFDVQTISGAGIFVSSDYRITTGAFGATEHSWRIGNFERARVNASRATFLLANDIALEMGPGVGTGDSAFYPIATSVGPRLAQLGLPGQRFQTVYLSFAPNVSSDARLKTDIGDISEAECRVADRIEIRRYKMADDPEGPWRFGAIAQEVIAAFGAEGLDWRDYSIVTGSEETSYGVVYDELQSLKLACM